MLGMDEDRMLPAEPSDVDIEVAPTEALVVGHDRPAGADAALEVALQLASGSGRQSPSFALGRW
jgi:hypothetical protein